MFLNLYRSGFHSESNVRTTIHDSGLRKERANIYFAGILKLRPTGKRHDGMPTKLDYKYSQTSPDGHPQDTDTSLGPEDTKNHTMPTPIMWTLGSVTLVSTEVHFSNFGLPASRVLKGDSFFRKKKVIVVFSKCQK